MKKILILLLLLVTIYSVSAVQEPRIITGQISINTTLGTNETPCGWFTIGFKDFTQKYTANTSITDLRNINFIHYVETSSDYENFTKSIDALVTSNMNMKDFCNDFVNDSKTYYQNYVDCSNELGTCDALYNESRDKAIQFDQCNDERSTYKSQKETCNANLATCTTDLEDKDKFPFGSLIIGAVIGGVIIYLYFNKGKKVQDGETSGFQQKW